MSELDVIPGENSGNPQAAARAAMIAMRESRGWSQSELARQVQPQTTPTQIRKLEMGAENGGLNISLEWMERLARAFGTTMSAFLPMAEVSQTDPHTAKILEVMRDVPPAVRPLLVKASAEVLSLARMLGTAETGPALQGDHRLAMQMAERWNGWTDLQRRRASDMLSAAENLATG